MNAKKLLQASALLLLGAIVLLPTVSQAVWHSVLYDPFIGDPPNWPWGNWTINPYRTYFQSGAPYVWGVQDYIFYPGGTSSQSLWCVGLPPTLDPEFDNYIPNTNSWAKWGPIDLTDAVAAKATFAYYNQTQPQVDYLRWGGYPSNSWNMYESDRISGEMSDWLFGTVDFDSLAEGTVSLLGQSPVYFLLHFSSNYDTEVDRGSFVAQVSISWDDGLFDIVAQSPKICGLDSLPLTQPFIGDTVLLSLDWKVYGSGTTPEFNNGCRLDGAVIFTERRYADIGSSQLVYMHSYADPWVITEGEHTVEWLLDYSFEIDEADETNNDTTMVFTGMEPNQPPWIEFTHPVYGDTANQQFIITWEDEDPDDNALIFLYWDDDSLGNDGQPIIGSGQIMEDDETDAFLWNVANFAEGEYWVFAYMTDPYNYIYKYSYGPLIVDHDWTGVTNQPQAVVSEFKLESVFPNPFNSSTQVRFALPAEDDITVRIFDAMGRLCAEPFSGRLSAGYHDVSWSPEQLPSGLYLFEIVGSQQRARTKALYVK